MEMETAALLKHYEDQLYRPNGVGFETLWPSDDTIEYRTIIHSEARDWQTPEKPRHLRLSWFSNMAYRNDDDLQIFLLWKPQNGP
ncbi:unnamed protein product [Soboliphyme baturini]|uniref:Uncharacterized protein n=1 Tax=Soboliphyme baturini TaxID=241478 RepID=A0A183IQ35_9BILA|nr:unnamed protein product [Soboliphyme baturini]